MKPLSLHIRCNDCTPPTLMVQNGPNYSILSDNKVKLNHAVYNCPKCSRSVLLDYASYIDLDGEILELQITGNTKELQKIEEDCRLAVEEFYRNSRLNY